MRKYMLIALISIIIISSLFTFTVAEEESIVFANGLDFGMSYNEATLVTGMDTSESYNYTWQLLIRDQWITNPHFLIEINRDGNQNIQANVAPKVGGIPVDVYAYFNALDKLFRITYEFDGKGSRFDDVEKMLVDRYGNEQYTGEVPIPAVSEGEFKGYAPNGVNTVTKKNVILKQTKRLIPYRSGSLMIEHVVFESHHMTDADQNDRVSKIHRINYTFYDVDLSSNQDSNDVEIGF